MNELVRIRVDSGAVELNALPKGTKVLIACASAMYSTALPDVIYTTDGVTWKPADETARYDEASTLCACWTGDRFLAFFSMGSEDPQLGYSYDGKFWGWEADPDNIFQNTSFPFMISMASNGDGLVAGVLQQSIPDPPYEETEMVLSVDHGATWSVISADVIGAPNFGPVAVHESTIVAGGFVFAAGRGEFEYQYDLRIVYSTDSGTTWHIATPPNSNGLRSGLYSNAAIKWVDGAWWVGSTSFNASSEPVGVIFKTTDFVTWQRVPTPWDRDAPGSSAPYIGDVYGIFVGGPDGKSVIVIGQAPPGAGFAEPADNQFLVSSDGGATWAMLTSTDHGNVAGALGVLSPFWVGNTSDTSFYNGTALWAFDRWWISNPTVIPFYRTPNMLSGSLDFLEWDYVAFGRDLIGDGSNEYMGGFGPLVYGEVQ